MQCSRKHVPGTQPQAVNAILTITASPLGTGSV